MAQKSIQGNKKLAQQIKQRRIALGLTIEEAASRAGVGTKTWSRYEAGESIRQDKCKGVCKALNWHSFPGQENDESVGLSIQDYKEHDAWSKFLENEFGVEAALAFAAGSDILLDYIEDDLTELSSMPTGSHIGQLDISLLQHALPEQFLMHYGYEFLYHMKCTLVQMRTRAKSGIPFMANSVLEELVLYLCNEEGNELIELCGGVKDLRNNDEMYYDEWVFDLFGDMDIITCLYSNWYLDSDHIYHFSHWNDQQFYVSEDEQLPPF